MINASVLEGFFKIIFIWVLRGNTHNGVARGNQVNWFPTQMIAYLLKRECLPSGLMMEVNIVFHWKIL